jgi:NADH-quinone oxidoreductase subunit N
VILSGGALLVTLLGVSRWRRLVIPFAWLVLAAAAVALWRGTTPNASLFFGLIVCDAIGQVVRWFALGVTALVLLLIVEARDVGEELRGEYLGLLLLIAVGLMLMGEAAHLLMAYVAMELVSLSSYALVGFVGDRRSAEASLKYLLFGALSSGVMLFGMSLLYGVSGQLGFDDLRHASAGIGEPLSRVLLVAVVFMLAGLAFKISMVPFHLWTPDAYEGAPVPVTALLSVGPKAAGLALLWRLMEALAPAWPQLAPLMLVLTIATMTLGNLVGLVQTNVKRLLAYSTIGQVGYLLIGFSVNSPTGLEALLLYLIAYLFMNLGAFACVVAVVNDTGSESLEAFRGLSKRAPAVALACALFLLSLAGLPPLLGFFGKFLLFGSAIESGHVWLAVAGVANSAIALYYYVNIIRLMYLNAPQREAPLRTAPALGMALAACVLVTVLFGLFPSPLLQLIDAQVNLL